MEKYQAVHPLFEIWHFDNSNELKDFKTAENYIDKFEITEQILNEFYLYCEYQKLFIEKIDKLKTDIALKPYLKAFIGRDAFNKDAYYPIINKNDKIFEWAPHDFEEK